MLRASIARLSLDFSAIGSKLSTDAARAELDVLRRSYDDFRKNVVSFSLLLSCFYRGDHHC